MRASHPNYKAFNATHDYRWYVNENPDERRTWKETLAAMCDTYGRHCGRWHENDFWKKTAADVEGMTEAEAETKVRRIEYDADMKLAQWESYQ